MSQFFPIHKFEFNTISYQYKISAPIIKLIVYGSLIIILGFILFMGLPQTRSSVRLLIQENAPVEILTFVFFLWAGIRGCFFAWKLKKEKAKRLVFWFYIAFSVALIVIAMEEVAWGQWFFHFDTPSIWQDINVQGELTLHNVRALQNRLEVFPLVAGVFGLLGVMLSSHPFFAKITPPKFLLSWFLVISSISSIDLFHDFIVLNESFDILINALDEVIEMMIGLSSLLLIWLNQKRFINIIKK